MFKLARRRASVVSIVVVAVGAVVLAAVHPTTGTAASSFSFALTGDVPYTGTDSADIDALVADINADDLRFVAHAGDIKSATVACSDSLIRSRFAAFQGFDDPFWYTPGDNDWTDCRTDATRADPVERLAFLRSVFYREPSRLSGGGSLAVTSQASMAGFGKFVENVVFRQECVVFGSIHQVGSGNGTSPWPNETNADRTRRKAEYTARIGADVAWVDEIFDRAEAAHASGVLVLIHAPPQAGTGYSKIRDRLAGRSAAFDGDVVIVHGDEHVQQVETGFLGLANVTRWGVVGGPGATSQWVRSTVDCSASPLFTQTVVETHAPSATTTTSTTTSVASLPVPTATTSIPEPVIVIDRAATATATAQRGRAIAVP